MVSPAILGLCVSLMADIFPAGAGTRIDLAAGGRAELNVGRIPVTSVATSAPGTEETIVLRSGIRLVSPTSTFRVTYAPQYYLRLPDALQVGRPLIFHSGTVGWNARPSRRLNLNLDLRPGAGELANSGLNSVFEPGTGRLNVSVIPIVQLASNFSLTATPGKRHTTRAAVSASHYDSLGASTVIQKSDNLIFSLAHSIDLNRRTSVGMSSQLGYALPAIQAQSAAVGAQLFVSQLLRESATLRLAGGFSYGWVLGGGTTWPLPTVDVQYTSRFTATGESWGWNLTGGTRAFFDITNAIYVPQLYISAGLSGQVRQAWTILPTFTFNTDLGGQDRPNGGQPTQFNLNVPITYRMNEHLRLAFGLRVALSGPPMWDLPTGVFQDQFSVFVALDWATGNEKTRGRWM